jgi:hypothetical protein
MPQWINQPWQLNLSKTVSGKPEVKRGGGFLSHRQSPWAYNELESLRYSNRPFGLIGADAGQRGHCILDEQSRKFLVNDA